MKKLDYTKKFMNLKTLSLSSGYKVDKYGGSDEIRTHCPFHAMEMLYQLSYRP